MDNVIYLRLQRNIVGGLVSGIGSLIGGAINARAQQKQNERNIQAQAEENQKNRDFTEEMYNKYESPVAQRQQMLEAGLNPMGAISPQSVGSASTSALPPGQAPEFGSAIQQGIQSFWEAGSAIRAQRLQDQEIEQNKLENWRLAFENGNAQALFDIQYQEISSRIALTREQKRLKRRELKALELEYNKAKEAYDAGINEHVDDHNLKVSEQNNLDANTTATTDANTRANDIHELNKKALDKQITLAEYQAQSAQIANRMASNEAEKSDTDSFIRTLTGIDMDKLNPILVPIVYQFAEAERRRMLTDEQFSAYVAAIQSYLSQERIMFLKKDPDYITALEGKQLSLEQRKQLFTEVLAQFNAELASKHLELDAISTIDKVFNIFK